METVTSHQLQQFQTLLLQTLQQASAFPMPERMYCRVKHTVLMVVLDYRTVDQLDRVSCARILKRSLLSDPLQQHPYLSATLFRGKVCCYLRKTGTKKPCAQYTYVIRQSTQLASTSSISTPSVLSSQGPHPQHNRSISPAMPTTSPPTLLSSSPTSHLSSSPSKFPLQTTDSQPLQAVDDKQLQAINTQKTSRPAFNAKWFSFRSWPKWRRWGVNIGAALALGSIGMGGYALTRPCVLGRCQLLVDAQSIHSPARSTLEPTTSFSAATQTHRTLLSLTYQLRKVPFWSPHYEEVRSLLAVYEQHVMIMVQLLGVQDDAQAAAEASQSPPHPLEIWLEIEQQWQQVIQKLQPLVGETMVAPLVNAKLTEYGANLSAIQYRIERETAARDVIQSVRQSIDVAEARSNVAQSLDTWQQIQAAWQTALEQLANIPTDTIAHAEASHLTAIYRPQWTKVRNRLQSETLSQQLYTDAHSSAKQAIQSEEKHQWTVAVNHWKDALESIQQVPQDTAFYHDVSPLTLAYSAALDQAKQQLTLAIALQKVESYLKQKCQGISMICQSVEANTVSNGTVQVWLSPSYGGAVETAMVSSGTKQLSNVPSNAVMDINQLLVAIATAGKTTQVPIELYRADGIHIGRYEPEALGYIQPHLALSENQVTLLSSDESH